MSGSALSSPEANALDSLLAARLQKAARVQAESLGNAERPVLENARRWHRNEKGLPLTLEGRPWLLDLYSWWPAHPRNLEVVLMTPPQEGKSELALNVAFTYAGEWGARVWYVLPKYELRNDFVATRVDVSIANTPRYRDRLTEAEVARDNSRLKHFGRGFIKFAGSNVRNEFISHPCDVAIADELNECVLPHVALLDDRMASEGAWRVMFKISTPTRSGFGISAEYGRSDRRRWFVPCRNCGTWQVLSWWKNVMEPDSLPDSWKLRDKDWKPGSGRDIRVLCSSCGAPVDRLARGEWRAERPDRTVVGFHVSKLFTAARTVEEMFARYRAMVEGTTPAAGEVFYNSILGEDYTGSTVAVTDELLRFCSGLAPYNLPRAYRKRPGVRVTAGMDVGKRLHVVVDEVTGGKRRAVFLGTAEVRVEVVADLVARFGIEALVVDARPEAKFVADLKARLNTSGDLVVYSCEYAEDRILRAERNGREALVKIDRTLALDEAKADMDTGRRLLPAEWESLDGGDFAVSMKGPARVDEKDSRGRPRTIWTKVEGDHYRHADAYAWIASTLLPPEAPVDWGTGGEPGPVRTFRGPEVDRGGWNIGLDTGGGDGGRIFR